MTFNYKIRQVDTISITAAPTQANQAVNKNHLDQTLIGYVKTDLSNFNKPQTAVFSTSAPGSPNNGDLWLNTNNGRLYVYYNDGTSSQWVQPAQNTLAVTASDINPGTANSLSYYSVAGSVLGSTGSNLTWNAFTNTLSITGSISATTISGSLNGNVTGNVTGNVSGNAGTVTNGVYTTGSYANPSWIASLSYSKLTGAPSFAVVATSGSFNDLINRPTVPTKITDLINDSSFVSSGTLTAGLNGKQDILSSGSNIKTVNGASLLGSGDVVISASANLLTGTINSTVLGNSNVFIGTTSIALNRASAAQSLTGITSIDGYSGSIAGGNNTTLLGSIPYQSNTNTTTLLSPNTSASLRVLTQTGTGTNGAAPVWTTTTGTGNIVLSASPSFTGTLGIGTPVAPSTVNLNGVLNAYSLRTLTKVDDTNVSGTYTMNCSIFDNWSITVTGATSLAFSNVPGSNLKFMATVIITQGGGGSITSWPTNTFWPSAVPPTLTTTTNKVDIFSFITWNGGATWAAVVIGQNY